MSWHMLRVELLNVDGMEQITLPPSIHILHQAWKKYYQTDNLLRAYGVS